MRRDVAVVAICKVSRPGFDVERYVSKPNGDRRTRKSGYWSKNEHTGSAHLGLMEDVQSEADAILSADWEPVDARTVPQVDQIALISGTSRFEAAVLFADLASSTFLVAEHRVQFAGHVIKLFLAAAARAIREYGGAIRSYDGDRIMALFIGDDRVDKSTRAALVLSAIIEDIVVPALHERWIFQSTYRFGYGIGLSEGTLHAIRSGIRNNNELVFLGLATNQAGKYSQIRVPGYHTFATRDFVSKIQDRKHITRLDGLPVWSHHGDFEAYAEVYATSCRWIF